MKKIAMIPARYAATRFPYKLMQRLGEKTVIRHTYENTVATNLFDEVYVVTDSDIIYEEITQNGGRAIMSIAQHESGSDRIAEAVEKINTDIILNVQGDEPFVSREPLKKLLDVFDDASVKVASIMKPFYDHQRAQNSNIVKVVVDGLNNSLLFSRSAIPFHRDKDVPVTYFEHIGVYAFRKEALMQFTKWQPTTLEIKEKIECLRYLEHGIALRMVETDSEMVKIDVPEDMDAAREYLKTYSAK